MIVGFSKYGTGSVKAAVTYLTGVTNPDGTQRTPPPVVLRGHPAFISRLIDSLEFEKTYKSGVLSFAPGETITPEMEQRIMDAFERVAFAGLERDQYAILWVRHTHAGHHELNFLIPRVELTTGKSLNIDPPGKQSQELFHTFRSMINAEYGLADPEDIARARDVNLPSHLAKLQANATRQGNALKADIREAITEYVRREVDAGRIRDRAGVVRYLKDAGYQMPRLGEDYVTVLDPETGDRIRLKGGLYREKQWNPRDIPAPRIRYGVPDPARAAELAEQLERMATVRAAYHRKRYGKQEPPQEQERGTPDLGDYMRQELGDDTIEPAGPGDSSPLRRRRERRRQAYRAEQEGKQRDDGLGAPAFRELGAVFDGARQRLTRTLGRSDAALAAGSRGARTASATYYGLDAARQRFEQGVADIRAAGHGLGGTGASFAAGVKDWLERSWWERFYGDMEPER